MEYIPFDIPDIRAIRNRSAYIDIYPLLRFGGYFLKDEYTAELTFSISLFESDNEDVTNTNMELISNRTGFVGLSDNKAEWYDLIAEELDEMIINHVESLEEIIMKDEKRLKEEKLKSIREDILMRSMECICGQREQDYGSPEDNFGRIAKLWSDYLCTDISSVDVAMMMSLLKIARVKGNGSMDCFVDLAGYAACGGEIWSGEHDS